MGCPVEWECLAKVEVVISQLHTDLGEEDYMEGNLRDLGFLQCSLSLHLSTNKSCCPGGSPMPQK